MTGRSGSDGVLGEVALRDPDGMSMHALARGTLVREGGCLYVESGGRRLLPVFPRGRVAWDGAVLVFDDEEHRLGDEIVLGGGLSRPGPDAVLPPGCDDTVPTFIVGDAGP